MSVPALWTAVAPLVLASSSRIRAAVLEAAGIPVEIVPAAVDERALEAPLVARSAPATAIAAHLARAKAVAVSSEMPGRLVLGADQVLALGAERLNKPADMAAARKRLRVLSGTTHSLHAAAALARDGAIVAETAQEAVLTMRVLSEDFLDRYLAAAGPQVCDSVGAYQLEGLGVHLFSKIAGDHFTVLGLPLLPLLGHLRDLGVLSA
jgi:septum formation protein